MVTDPSPPATKLDIELLMKDIGNLYIANERWKNEVLEKMDKRFEAHGKKLMKEIKLYFDVTAENMLHDFRGGWNDKFVDHDRRITVLEQKV